MKRGPILVTGGAGFIGSHLIDLLSAESVEFVVLDNLSNGSASNIPSAISKSYFIQGDVTDYTLMTKLIRNAAFVVHMACTVGVKNVMSRPLDSIDSNINALKKIAYECSINNVPLVFFSSSLVYSGSNKKNQLFSEDEQTHALGFHPVSIYVSSKITGELICEYYKKTIGLKYIIIRPFNMIGIRQRGDSGMVVPSFVRSALVNRSINVYGTGKQTRSFSDVKIAVKLLWELMDKENSFGEIFNLATTDKSITILELAELIKEILDNRIKINFVPLSEILGDSYRDVDHRSPSLDKLRHSVPHWRETNLRDILKEIIEYEKRSLHLD